MPLTKDFSPYVTHVQGFTGNLWYVSTIGSDANSGVNAEAALASVGVAITAAAAGDRIVVKAGTYSEAGYEIPAGKDGLELVCEHGVTLTDSGSSTQTVLITSNNCVFSGASVTESGQIGVKVVGSNCKLERVISGPTSTTAFDIDGAGCRLDRCFAALPTVSGFDFGGGQIKAFDCQTISGASSTIGYRLSAGNYGIIQGCNSNGHETSGFQVDSGVGEVMIVDCTSGPNDGARIDNGTTTAWRNFHDAEHGLDHVKKYTGEVYYVKTDGNNSLKGKSPNEAKRTIAAAITAASAGDMIVVKAGTYDEAVTMNKAGLEIHCEIGTTITNSDTATQTVLMSAASCNLVGAVVAQAGQIGIKVTAARCRIEGSFVTASTVAFDIDGAATVIQRSGASGYTTTGFDISAANVVFVEAYATGSAGNTRGFYLSAAGADSGLYDTCTSVANVTGGFAIASGANYNSFTGCLSGGDDGKFVDAGEHNQTTGLVLQSPEDHHEHLWPVCDGEGTAFTPISVSNNTTDGAAGTRNDRYYWGDTIRVVNPEAITTLWSACGLYVLATTTADIQQWEVLFVRPSHSSAQNAGNDWDENETELTVADGSIFLAGDYVWITGNDKEDGEIVKVASVSTNVVTIERETTADGEAGLRYVYDVDASANKMFVASRPGIPYLHKNSGVYSAGSARDFDRINFHRERRVPANTGMIMRMANLTDDGVSTFDVFAIYED